VEDVEGCVPKSSLRSSVSSRRVWPKTNEPPMEIPQFSRCQRA
jgi:hypothetical protein